LPLSPVQGGAASAGGAGTAARLGVYGASSALLVWLTSSRAPGRGGEAAPAVLPELTRARREAEAAARLVDLAPDGIVTVDHAGRIVLANTQAHSLFGYAPGELPGRPVDDLLPDRLRGAHASHRASYAASPRTRPMGEGLDLVARRKDGSEFAVEISLSPVAPDGGIAAMAAIRDISDRKRAEDRITALHADLARRVAELGALNQELESFSYSVSHDLRAPLRSIAGFSQALREDYTGRLDAQADDYLGRITAAATRMGALIDDLLGLSRVSRREMHREPVDVGAIAAAVVEQLRRAEPERRVDVAIGEGLRASADPALLRVVIENLLGNAWKFTSGRPVARIELGPATASGPGAYCVRDNGVGFDMAYAHKLFGAFQRLHAAHEFPGTGIGLATVQRIISRHGGRVWAESEPGAGAAFYFTLGEGT
jgi:PAS domain S-box-containing protein